MLVKIMEINLTWTARYTGMNKKLLPSDMDTMNE